MSSSFDEAILQEPERFIGYAFDNNKDISHFGDFKNALNGGFANNKGFIDEETYIELFEHPLTKSKVKENVTQSDYEKLYGDGHIVERMAVSPTRMVTIVTPKIKTKSYTRNGKVVKAYNRGFKKWSPAESQFIKVRKEKGVTTKQIIKEFNAHYKQNARSSSSIKAKIYRK